MINFDQKICIPGIFLLSVKFAHFHQQKLPKDINFTYLEDPSILIYIHIIHPRNLILKPNMAILKRPVIIFPKSVIWGNPGCAVYIYIYLCIHYLHMYESNTCHSFKFIWFMDPILPFQATSRCFSFVYTIEIQHVNVNKQMNNT